MWKIVKSEIEYFRWLYIISIAIVIIINFGLTLDGRWIEAQDDFPGLRVIWLGVGIVVLFFAILFNRKSGRLQKKMLLPVSTLQIGLARILAFTLFWLTLSLVLILFYLLNFQDLPDINWIVNFLSITGIILLINSIPLLYSDFYSTYFGKKEKFLMRVFWSILWLIYIFLNIIFADYFDSISPIFFEETRKTLSDIYFSSEITILNITVGTLIFTSSLVTFKNRKLYLE